jgi:hypothetical protein
MKDKLLLLLFFVVMVVGFISIILSVARVFVANVNSKTTEYFAEGNFGIEEVYGTKGR